MKRLSSQLHRLPPAWRSFASQRLFQILSLRWGAWRLSAQERSRCWNVLQISAVPISLTVLSRFLHGGGQAVWWLRAGSGLLGQISALYLLCDLEHKTLLRRSFLIYEMGPIIVTTHRIFMKTKWDTLPRVLDFNAWRIKLLKIGLKMSKHLDLIVFLL